MKVSARPDWAREQTEGLHSWGLGVLGCCGNKTRIEAPGARAYTTSPPAVSNGEHAVGQKKRRGTRVPVPRNTSGVQSLDKQV
jgi:hypothetical protein